MESILLFVVGLLVGAIMTIIALPIKSVGCLRIDRSDPNEKPYLFLELSKDVDTISKKKYVLLEVNNKNFISHK